MAAGFGEAAAEKDTRPAAAMEKRRKRCFKTGRRLFQKETWRKQTHPPCPARKTGGLSAIASLELR